MQSSGAAASGGSDGIADDAIRPVLPALTVEEVVGVNEPAVVVPSEDAQFDEEVDSFLRADDDDDGEDVAGGAGGGVGKSTSTSSSSSSVHTGVVEAKWSDFKFSQNGSFSDFLYDLGGGQGAELQPFVDPALDSDWLTGTAAAADANGSYALEQHFASKLDLTSSFSSSGHGVQAATYTVVREVQLVSPKGGSPGGGAQAWQDGAGEGVLSDLSSAGRVDEYKSGFAVVTTATPSPGGGGGQQLETVQSQYHEQKTVLSNNNEFADPSLYCEDPQYPGWLYCYATGQWVQKPVAQVEKHGGADFSSDSRLTTATVEEDPDFWSSSRESGPETGISESAPAAGSVHHLEFPQQADSFKDSDDKGGSSPSSSQANSVILHHGEDATSAGATSSSSGDTTAGGSPYIRDGRGYDPNYPGWYYDYQLQQWCSEEVVQPPPITASPEKNSGFSQQSVVLESCTAHVTHDTAAQDSGWYSNQTETYLHSEVGLQAGVGAHSGGASQHQYAGEALEAKQYAAVPQDQQERYPGGYLASGKPSSQPEQSMSYVADSQQHYDAQRTTYSSQHLAYSAGAQSQSSQQPYAPSIDHQGPQQFYATGSYGKQTLTAKQEQHGSGATNSVLQGNRYSGMQGNGVPYQMAVGSQQAVVQASDPPRPGQYSSGSFRDSRSGAAVNAHTFSAHNELQSESWARSQVFPAAQTGHQALLQQGSSLGSASSGTITYGQEHVDGGWSNGFMAQPGTSSLPAQIYHQQQQQQQYQYDQQQYTYQHQQLQQAPQQQSSAFPMYGQQWGLSSGNHQYQQAQGWSPVVSVPKTAAEAVRTTAGRPPQALCAFGFGGKFVIMKQRDLLNLQTSDGEQLTASGQAWTSTTVRLLDLSQLVSPTVESGHKAAGSSYFESLSRRAFNGPLVGGNVSSKELLKWIDEREKLCKEEAKDSKFDDLHRKSLESLSDLWGVLKIMCQHHGKLRSTIGTTGLTLQEADGPEIALANLLASETPQNEWAMGTSTLSACLQNTPAEQQLQRTAADMTKLLIAGKRKEALQHATEGQLWGPALLLAWQLGEKFYGETVIEMSRRLLVAGSPLRTLSLLLAGQPVSEIFAGKGVTVPTTTSPYGAAAFSGTGNSTQDAVHRMVEEWRSNLAIVAANRTNNDDRVLMYLGDCLMEMRQEVEAAHICYLVADSNFEPFSQTARLCLLGANHRLYPRTYVTPEAIQRTELYEHAKVLGNPQFFLPHFQPYKLVYAHMLVEAGKKSEALRYCQAVLKMLKMAGRAPDVETCRQAAASLEERIKIYTHGGPSAVPKLFQGLTSILKTVDKGISGIMGGGPPPTTAEPYSNFGGGNGGSMVAPTDVRATPSLLVPSSSVDPLHGLVNGNDRTSRPSRSASEPDFSKSPRNQVKQEAAGTQAAAAAAKPPAKAGSSNSVFARFGSNILQRTGFFGGKSSTEAKLGEKNKFYYDEKLKRWVEEGAEPAAEEAVLAPPPMSSKFVNKVEDTYVSAPSGPSASLGSAPSGPSVSLGTPPIPPSGNQFSARSRQGVRSRYVDTLSKGGSVPTPSVSSLVPAARASPSPPQAMNFFVPAPVVSSNFDSSDFPDAGQGSFDATGTSSEANGAGSCQTAGFESNEQGMPGQMSSQPVSLAPSSIHRVASVGNAVGFVGFEKAGREGRGTDHSRAAKSGSTAVANGSHHRAASWGGYPSTFQNVGEPPSTSPVPRSAGLPASADYLMARNVLPNSSPSHGGPYFVAPSSQMEVEPSFSSQLASVSPPLPPPVEGHRAAPLVDGLPLVHMGTMQNGHLAGVTLNAEEMQEVEL